MTLDDPTTSDPPADGGYPRDRQLHQMSDDGGPVGPDPARWIDLEWRDNSPAPDRVSPLPSCRDRPTPPPAPADTRDPRDKPSDPSTRPPEPPTPTGSLRWRLLTAELDTRDRWRSHCSRAAEAVALRGVRTAAIG